MTTKMSPEKLQELVRMWLMEDGWSLRQETPQNGLWAFIADDGKGRKIVVGQNVNRPDTIILQGGINIDDVTSQKVDNLSEKDRDALLWDLRFGLLGTELEFMGIEIPLKLVQLSARVIGEALSKDCFLQRVSELRKGVLFVIWTLARKFSQQPPRQQLGFQR